MTIDHTEAFKEWASRNEPNLFSSLSDVMDSEMDLKIGDKVMFTNDYGVVFGPYEVLGFCNPSKWGNCVYLNKSSYWFPCKVEQLTKVE